MADNDALIVLHMKGRIRLRLYLMRTWRARRRANRGWELGVTPEMIERIRQSFIAQGLDPDAPAERGPDGERGPDAAKIPGWADGTGQQIP